MHFVDVAMYPKRGTNTARKSLISTGREPLVCTGFPTGTVPSVLNAPAFYTGQSDRYEKHSLVLVGACHIAAPGAAG